MRALVAVLTLATLTACKQQPLAEAILGEWEVWCRTDRVSTSTCLGREDAGLYKIFRSGGSVVAGARQGTSMEGRWELTGDELVLTFSGAGISLQEEYQARIEDEQLVLWNRSGDFGTVLGRTGAKLEPAPSPESTGQPVTHELGGVRYSLGLPAGYRLTRDDNRRQRWSPSSGEGLSVSLSVSERARTQQGGQWVTPPCNSHDYGGVLGSSARSDGIERDISIGTSHCIEGTNLVLMCSVEHSRGHLEEADEAPALALCKSLEPVRSRSRM